LNRFFILGNPRSGTSLLRLILNAHPHIIAPPESGFLHWWSKKYQDWKDVSLEAFADDILSSKKIEDWGLDRASFIKLLHVRNPQTYVDAAGLVYELYAEKLGKEGVRAVVDKNNYYIHHISDLIQIWPDASFIHIIRDGRDVACSYRGIHRLKSSSPYLPKLPSSIEEIAGEWQQNNSRIIRELKEANRSSFTLRYEDLVQKPAEVLNGLMNFMGLPVADAMFAFNKSNDEPESTIDWKQLTRGPITSSQVGQYKEQLSEKEIEVFQQIAGDLLSAFSYLENE
jgi:hypothetical protein